MEKKLEEEKKELAAMKKKYEIKNWQERKRRNANHRNDWRVELLRKKVDTMEKKEAETQRKERIKEREEKRLDEIRQRVRVEEIERARVRADLELKDTV